MSKRINTRPIVLGIIMVALFFVLFPTSARASGMDVILRGDVDPRLEEIAVRYHHESIQAWHHSDKRWSNEKLGMSIPDSVIGGDLRLLKSHLIPDTGYPFDVPLPYEVIQAMNEGKKVTVKVESAHPGFKLEHMMNYLDQPERHPVTISGNNMRIMMHPYFNYELDPISGTALLGHMEANFDINLNIPFI